MTGKEKALGLTDARDHKHTRRKPFFATNRHRAHNSHHKADNRNTKQIGSGQKRDVSGQRRDKGKGIQPRKARVLPRALFLFTGLSCRLRAEVTSLQLIRYLEPLGRTLV